MAVNYQPIAPSSKDNIKTAALRSTALGTIALGSTALGTTALGSTALGSTALGSVVLGKSLINQPLIRCLLDYLLGRSFSRQWNINTVVDLILRQDW